jgi:hypothetical protein
MKPVLFLIGLLLMVTAICSESLPLWVIGLLGSIGALTVLLNIKSIRGVRL